MGMSQHPLGVDVPPELDTDALPDEGDAVGERVEPELDDNVDEPDTEEETP